MRPVRPGSLLAAALLAGLVGCSSARTLEEGADVNECARCHGFPPATTHDGKTHPTVASEATACSTCHSDTVAPTGDLIAGGAHQNGQVDVTVAHDVPYPAHPSEALADIQLCKACHGDDYGGGSSGASCTGCHAAAPPGGAGIASWTANCTFCHGTRTNGVTTATAQAAPPQSVSGSGDQTNANPKVGAHQRHLAPGVAPALPCASCHSVPTSEQALTHFTGNGAPGAISFGDVARKGAPDAAYAGASATAGGSCNVYCHGSGAEFTNPADKRSPAWTSTGVTCTTCHGRPPASGPTVNGKTAHEFHVGDQGQACTRCHPAPPAQHVNGTKDVVVQPPGTPAPPPVSIAGWDCTACHGALGIAGHAMPYLADHPPAALANIGSCTGCHGADYAGGSTGFSCNGCHAQDAASAPDWKQNCTWCHGTRTAGVTTATAAAAPPQSVVPTADQTSANPRIGAHQAHLAEGLAPALPCSSCHAVPTAQQALAHFAGNGAQGAVTFSAAATKGVTGAAYAGGSCNVYCHGAGSEFENAAGARSPPWTSAGAAFCGSCHALPPLSGPTVSAKTAHDFHVTDMRQDCAVCHPDPPARHVNGTKDVVVQGTGGPVTIVGWDCAACHAALGIATAHPLPYVAQHASAALADIASCTSCHGATYGGGIGPSCNACHANSVAASAPDWKTNCTFCHGTRTAGVTTATAATAPPQPVVMPADVSTSNPRVGAHQKHVRNDGTLSNGVACTECHPAASGLTHFGSGTAALAWGPLATNGGTVAASKTGNTCSNYCHGATTPGAQTLPGWAPPSTMTCASCHEANPTTGEHPSQNSAHRSFACSVCHGAGFTAGTSVNKGLHVDRLVNKDPSLNWQGPPAFTTRSCFPQCHADAGKGRENW